MRSYKCVIPSHVIMTVILILAAEDSRRPGSLERRIKQALRLGLEPAAARALAAVALVRLLLMPLASIAVVRGGLGLLDQEVDVISVDASPEPDFDALRWSPKLVLPERAPLMHAVSLAAARGAAFKQFFFVQPAVGRICRVLRRSCFDVSLAAAKVTPKPQAATLVQGAMQTANTTSFHNRAFLPRPQA